MVVSAKFPGSHAAVSQHHPGFPPPLEISSTKVKTNSLALRSSARVTKRCQRFVWPFFFHLANSQTPTKGKEGWSSSAVLRDYFTFNDTGRIQWRFMQIGEIINNTLHFYSTFHSGFLKELSNLEWIGLYTPLVSGVTVIRLGGNYCHNEKSTRV